LDDSGFANDRPANPVLVLPKTRRTWLLLLGEKAGLREDVQLTFQQAANVAQAFGHDAARMGEISMPIMVLNC
jgi:hypothetical protein